jgi:hypothetical protein
MNSLQATRRARWSESDLQLFAKLHLEKKPADFIAAHLGRTPKSITNQISDMNRLKTPTAKKLAELVAALSKPAPAPKPINHRAAWTAVADNNLITLYVTGHSPEQIAKGCGRTVAAIAGRLHALSFLVFDKDTLTYSTAPKVWYKIPT